MAIWSRRLPVPGGLRALLQAHERILAMADVSGPEATVVAATNLGLWIPDSGGASGWRRIPWNEIVKATWDDGGLVVVAGTLDADGVVRDEPPIVLALSEPRNLPSTVRDRVETSIARSEQVVVPGGTARLVARRTPGVDGVSWTARLDSGTPESAAGREVLLAYLRQAASSAEPDSGPA